MKKRVTRRNFIKQAAAASFASQLIVPRLSFAASPSGRLQHAAIGVGGQGEEALHEFLMPCAAPLREQLARMVGIFEVAMALIATRMSGDEFVVVINAQANGIAVQCQTSGGVFGGHGVAVGVICCAQHMTSYVANKNMLSKLPADGSLLYQTITCSDRHVR